MMMEQKPCMRRVVPMMEDGQTPSLWEDETIDFTLKSVELAFDVDAGPLGSGALFVTSKRVLWIGDNGSTCDFDVPYITLHAVSRDPATYPKSCVYCQLDSEEDSDGLKEMFLVPGEEADVMKLFEALSHAALVNPDPLEDGEQEGDDELIFDADEVRLGAEQARILDHLESVFVEPNGLQGNDDDEDRMDT